MRDVEVPAMAEQSHREEMNAAIRAQRERSAAPKTIAPEPQADAATTVGAEAAPPPTPEPTRRRLGFRRK